MEQFNQKVDDYIENSAAFAKPILNHLRQIIHQTCPGVQEEIKWGIPHFDYNGDYLLMMAGFKNHCSFSLYKAAYMTFPEIVESVKAGKKYGYMDKLQSLLDLPAKKVLVKYIKEAMTINDRGIRMDKSKSEKPKVLETPGYLLLALHANYKAKIVWENKSASFRKNYVIWIMDAKTEATRQKRIDQSLEWIAEGKGRFWQYEKK